MPARFETGQLAVSGSAQQIRPRLAGESDDRFGQYKFKAPSTNSQLVCIGDSSVTASNGYALEPGDVLLYEISADGVKDQTNLDEWWAAGTPGDTLVWIGFQR